MAFLKEWSFCVCVSLIFAVILSLFTPSGKMKSFYKLLLAFFVFVSFLYPLKDRHISDFHLNIPDVAQAQEETASQTLEASVNRNIRDALKKQGINGAAVNSTLRVNYDTGAIEIERVVVALPDAYDKQTVQQFLFEKLGILAEVKGIGE